MGVYHNILATVRLGRDLRVKLLGFFMYFAGVIHGVRRAWKGGGLVRCVLQGDFAGRFEQGAKGEQDGGGRFEASFHQY